ncbi:MAG: endonuclease V [Candidatus Bathyarchaeota archaeon]|nr:endonuclease V [Candidatus Bathyarchaeota archaeon]
MIDLDKLRIFQDKLSKKVMIKDSFKRPIKLVSGIDVAYLNEQAIISIAVFNYQNKEFVDNIISIEDVSFPYIPGFFGFREGTIIIKTIKKLNLESDIIMVNAHGIAHPRKYGCASHIGLIIKRATIGVVNNILYGNYKKKPLNIGDWVPLENENQIIGAVLKSKQGCKPIIVSPGHLITLESALAIVKKFLKGHKFPEPLHIAHVIAKQKRREILESRL